MEASLEALSRVDVRLGEMSSVLSEVVVRLSSLEQRVESIIAPPRAFSLKEASKLLGCSPRKLSRLIQSGKLRTVEIGEREHVPMSEVVRLTTVTTSPKSSPRVAPPRLVPSNGAQKIRDAIKSSR